MAGSNNNDNVCPLCGDSGRLVEVWDELYPEVRSMGKFRCDKASCIHNGPSGICGGRRGARRSPLWVFPVEEGTVVPAVPADAMRHLAGRRDQWL